MKRILLMLIALVMSAGVLFSQNAADFETKENKDGTLTIVKYTGAPKNAVIPEKIGGKYVTKIQTQAFNYTGATSITSVTIPYGVTEIGKSVFPPSLVSVTLGASVKLSEYTVLEKVGDVAMRVGGAIGAVYFSLKDDIISSDSMREVFLQGVPDDSSIGNGFESFYKKNNKQGGTYKRQPDSTDWTYTGRVQ